MGWPAFTSASLNMETSMGFGNVVFELRCNPPEGFYKDDDYEYAPADIKEFKTNATESEILFPPNVKFKVLEVQMPSSSNKLQSPLVICDTAAFDTDDNVLQDFKS